MAAPSDTLDLDATLERIEQRRRTVGRRLTLLTFLPAVFFGLLALSAVSQRNQALESMRRAQMEQAAAERQRLLADSAADAARATRDSLVQVRASLEAARAGINLFHSGQYAAAVRAYDTALRTDPSNAYLLNLKGYAQFRAGRLDEAAATIRRGLAADSGYGYGYFDLARVACAQGRMDDALTAAREALRRRPDLRAAMLSTDREFTRLCAPILGRLGTP
jgi:tetratricopeptide (TPR) repeat protein